MPAKCRGMDGIACTFGKKNGSMRVGKGRCHCVWCSAERMKAACESKAGRASLVRDFKRMRKEQQVRALDRIPQHYIATFQSLMQDVAPCQGCSGEPCTFDEENTGQPARVQGQNAQCDWCDLEALSKKCATSKGRAGLLARLRGFSAAAADKLITTRIPKAHREYFTDGVARAPPGRGRPAACKRPAAKKRRTWEETLARRQSHTGAPSEEQKKRYRQQKLDDRARVRRNFDMRKRRHESNAEVSNDTGLPPPKRSKLAQNLWNWCLTESWKMCDVCGKMQVMPLTQKSLTGPPGSPTISARECKRCSAEVDCPAPTPEDVPQELRDLGPEATAALAHLECDVGPEVFARNAGGQRTGYPQKTTITLFFWHKELAKDRIKNIRNKREKRKARAARKFLLKREGCSDQKFEEAHKKFLTQHPDAGERHRRRRLVFIETPALETAVWPHLFHEDDLCLTVVRATDKRRIGRAKGPTMEQLMDGELPSEDELQGSKANDNKCHSTKRAYASLALSSRIGYGSNYKLLQFAYDFNLWSAIGAKKKTSKDYGTPMRVLMKDHSFSPLYWKAVHFALIDMVKQMGHPKIFWTLALYEWSMPYHRWMLDEMAKELRGRMDLPVAESLHMIHVMLQVVRGGAGEGVVEKPDMSAAKH